jgi:hypothetical protein
MPVLGEHTCMKSLINTPLEQIAANWWGGIDDACKKAFFVAVAVNVLAFGFEMTNLSLHHDDVQQIFIEDTILGHYLGRFGVGWLYYYTQNHYFMPFLQLAEGIVLMSVYGVVVARFWGARKATDIALIAAIVCVFPYMAQTYQYNTSMAANPLAHLLAAAAVVLSTRGTVKSVAIAAALFLAAFSIYQAVAANAATIFLIWLLARLLFGGADSAFVSRQTVRATIATFVAAVLGGLVYLVAVSTMDIPFDSEQAAETAFRLGGATKLSLAMREIWRGTRGFFIWPERYFPDYLKDLQLVLLAAAGVFCLWVPRAVWSKAAAFVLLALAAFAPRLLQLVHPEGQYHSLTLTGYAVLIAGAVMIVIRSARTLTRNVAIVVTMVLVAGYVLQCNWISTVNYLNMFAHFETLTQVLARVRSLPDAGWDGKKIVVVGRYEMPTTYPFTTRDAVAPKFLDATHMLYMARLMRDEATFVAADTTMPRVLDYARSHPPWPNPASVAIVDGMGVIVFANAATPLKDSQ